MLCTVYNDSSSSNNTTYVLKYNNMSVRSFIAQVRAGVLPLKVEVGRFIQQKLEERMCDLQLCKTVEKEPQFIFDCPLC